MKVSARHQQIVDLLLQNGVMTVAQLVELLQVSEVTVRNDLRALERQGRLIRTHGGAAIGSLPRTRRGRPPAPRQPEGAGLADGLLRLAQRAAALVGEGETVLLLNSPVAQAMVDELLKIRSLPVLTNSLHIASALQRNPANTVMLVGGQLRADGDTLDGPIAMHAVSHLRVQKAFLTCDGLDREHGFADDDLASTQLKAAILDYAQTVIVLAPADRVGRSALMSFASTGQVQHLITTEGAPLPLLNDLRAAGVQVTVCSPRLTQIAAEAGPSQRWRLGFANLTEKHEFAVAVRQGLEQAAKERGSIELVMADNASDPDIAVANARELLDPARGRVDLLIEYQQDEHANYVIMDLCRSAGVPVIAVDIPASGAVYFGVDNYRVGSIAGDAAVRWIQQRWDGRLDKVVCLEQPESGVIPATRIQAQLDRLQAAFHLAEADIIRCDTHGDLEASPRAAIQALRNIPWSKRVLMIGINFNSALGSLAAAEALDRQEHTAVVSQNASARIRQELLRRNPMLIGAVDYFPQHYGAKLLPIALDLLEGRPTPPAVYTEHLLLTSANVRQVYPEDTPAS